MRLISNGGLPFQEASSIKDAAEARQALAPDLTLADRRFPEALSRVIPAAHLLAHAAVVLHGFSLLQLLRYVREEILLVLGTSSSEAALPVCSLSSRTSACARTSFT
jgi:hypothetical protein